MVYVGFQVAQCPIYRSFVLQRSLCQALHNTHGVLSLVSSNKKTLVIVMQSRVYQSMGDNGTISTFATHLRLLINAAGLEQFGYL